MARTKQTARASTGGKAPKKVLMGFDQTGNKTDEPSTSKPKGI